MQQLEELESAFAVVSKQSDMYSFLCSNLNKFVQKSLRSRIIYLPVLYKKGEYLQNSCFKLYEHL